MSLTIDNLAKNVGDFSITQSYKDFIVDRDFTKKANSSQSTVFPTLSAMSEQIGEVIYENILNYIDNIGNVDICKIQGLKQHCKLLAIDYSIIDKIKTFPLEIQQLLDVFSINPSYLLSTGFFKDSEFDKQFSSGFSQTAYDNVVSACFYTTLTSILSSKYVNYSEVSSNLLPLSGTYQLSNFDSNINVIYKNISSELFNEDDENLLKKSMISSKNEYCVPMNFNESDIMTNIENDMDSFDNYSRNEQQILSIEQQNRHDYMYVPLLSSRLTMLPTSRFAWYKEKKVKDYVQFILTNHCLSNLGGTIYSFDTRYLELNDSITISSLINKSTLALDDSTIRQCAQSSTNIAKQMCKVRYQIKEIPQKYYIRGSFLLLNHLINEILIEEGSSNAQVSLQSYDDNTEYFNLKTDTTSKAYNRFKTNRPYFEDIVKTGLIDIDNFYLSAVQKQTELKCVSADYDEFLLDMYKYGASKTYVDRETMELCATNDSNNQIALSYFGNKFGYKPWLNFKNQTHPSYQIHPCLYNFVKYANIPQVIKHSFDSVMNDEYQVNIVNDISNYVGKYGNIVSAWNNGVDEFFGYNSRYEDSPHRARNGTKCIYADYDGFAYDEAYNYFINSNKPSCVNSIRNRSGYFYDKYYKHLHLKENEAKYYADKISAASYPDSNWTINQYTLDIYHNCYCILNDNTAWIRFDSHVLPIPLSSFLKDHSSISFMEFNKDVNAILFKDNNKKYYAGKIQMKYNNEKPKFYEYNINDLCCFGLTSGTIIKYENCIGLYNKSGNSLSIKLYDYNTGKIKEISRTLDKDGTINVEFDQIQVAYVSAFDAGINYPCYANNVSTTLSTLSGTAIVVDTYDIVNRSVLRKLGTQYFQCQDDVENGLIPVFHNIPYVLQDDSEAQMFQLMSVTKNTSPLSNFPYGRLTHIRTIATNLSSNGAKYTYISSIDVNAVESAHTMTVSCGTINYNFVSSVSLSDGLISYTLWDNSVLQTNIQPIFQTENDIFGNNQYAISSNSYLGLKSFESNLSGVFKCSEQDWTMYYDMCNDVGNLCIDLPLSSLSIPAAQYLFDIDGYEMSVFADTQNTLYVNYEYAIKDIKNKFLTQQDVYDKEMPTNTYLKLLSGMSGILWCDGNYEGRKIYVRNFSNSQHQRIAIKKI